MCGACGRNYIGSVYKKKTTKSSNAKSSNVKSSNAKSSKHKTWNSKQSAIIQNAKQHVENNPGSVKSVKIQAILKLLNT